MVSTILTDWWNKEKYFDNNQSKMVNTYINLHHTPKFLVGGQEGPWMYPTVGPVIKTRILEKEILNFYKEDYDNLLKKAAKTYLLIAKLEQKILEEEFIEHADK